MGHCTKKLYRPSCSTILTSSVPEGFVAEPKREISHCETQCVITFKEVTFEMKVATTEVSVVGSD